MHIRSRTYNRIAGQSLIEVLFGLTLAVMAISSISYLYLNAEANARAVSEHVRAEGLAQEGLAAAAAIAQEDFGSLSAAAHGLTLENGRWTFSGSSDETEQFTRVITLRKLSAGVFEVASTVSWSGYGGRDGSISVASAVSNWRQNTGSAAALTIDLSNLVYSSGGTIIDGISLLSDSSLSATGLTLYWDSPAQLASSTIAGVEVFNASGTDPISSGESIEFDPIELSAGNSTFGPHTFTEDIREASVLAALHLSDGTARYFRISI